MSLTEEDISVLAGIMRDAARTEILPRFRRLRPGAIRTKTSAQDLVTDADEAAEARMTAALERAFPGVLVVGEEAAAGDATLIPRLAGAPFAIVLDPIDGTANYAAGLPLFGVMAAVVEAGETIAAIILDPITDSYSAARRGHGATEHAADGSTAPLRVAPAVPLAQMTGTASWRFLPPRSRADVLATLPRLASVWDNRCAAHEYRTLIAGHAHFVLFNRLMPWDHLPGVLLHGEAGGYAAKFDGSRYVPGETMGGLICTPDQVSWETLRGALLGEQIIKS
jgi:fructose-1,6-bisphosphatase/inositol monophosphatase family enzyme